MTRREKKHEGARSWIFSAHTESVEPRKRGALGMGPLFQERETGVLDHTLSTKEKNGERDEGGVLITSLVSIHQERGP